MLPTPPLAPRTHGVVGGDLGEFGDGAPGGNPGHAHRRDRLQIHAFGHVDEGGTRHDRAGGPQPVAGGADAVAADHDRAAVGCSGGLGAERAGDRCVGGDLSLRGVHVDRVDSGVGDVDEDVLRPGLGQAGFLDSQRLAVLGQAGSCHTHGKTPVWIRLDERGAFPGRITPKQRLVRRRPDRGAG